MNGSPPPATRSGRDRKATVRIASNQQMCLGGLLNSANSRLSDAERAALDSIWTRLKLAEGSTPAERTTTEPPTVPDES